MKRISAISILLLLLLELLGCGAISTQAYREAFRNASTQQSPANNVESRAAAAFRTGKPFVGIAISGGGSRAAVFGAAVLRELEERGFLKFDDVVAISAVSGGALPASVYALERSQSTQAWDWPGVQKALSQDILSAWIYRNLSPANLLRLTFTDRTRTHLLGELLDEQFFHGATFSDIDARNGPQLLLGATNVTDDGRVAILGNGPFARAHDLKIGYGVAISGAFPGVFNSVALPDNSQSDRGQFIHLIDGGPADNMGIDVLIRYMVDGWSATTRARPAGKRGCFLFAIDAYQRSPDPTRKTQSDPRAWYDHLADSNAFDAIDALLGSQRQGILGRYGLALPEEIAQQNQIPRELGRISINADSGTGVHGVEECIIWHLSFDNLKSWQLPFFREPELRSNLFALSQSIGTSYKLASSGGCSQERIANGLALVAQFIVRESWLSSAMVCKWLETNLDHKCSTDRRFDAYELADGPTWRNAFGDSGRFVGTEASVAEFCKQ